VPRLFGWLPKRRWLRWLILLPATGLALLLILGVIGYLLLQRPGVQSRLMTMLFDYQLKQPLAEPPLPSLSDQELQRLSRHAATLDDPDRFFSPTNVWDVHLAFSGAEWATLGPRHIPPMPGFQRADGRIVLRNPEASRPGLAGVLGMDFPWSSADVQLGGELFTNAAVRLKGNGTFLSALRSYKRPFKVDLSGPVAGRKIAGRSKFNFGNLLAENSMLTDTMGYEFYREAGVPAVRTTFARVLLSIGGRFDERLLGLYLITEEPDRKWARDFFGRDGVAVFKPVTYELFKYLGDEWTDYQDIYHPKTDVSREQQQRLIDLARLCTRADDPTFGAAIGDYLDLPEFATWLACETTLANYDGFLTTGQNFLLYLDPGSNRFRFGPWDLDHSWGEFPFVATAGQREHASIWHPWTGGNRLLERLFAHEPFRALYRGELERLQATLFDPARLGRRLDELAAVIRPIVGEESTNRLAQFEKCVASTWPDGPRDGDPMDPNRPAYPLKRFFEARAKSIRAQLDGTEEGVRLTGMGRP
jgi:spore coat protein H